MHMYDLSNKSYGKLNIWKIKLIHVFCCNIFVTGILQHKSTMKLLWKMEKQSLDIVGLCEFFVCENYMCKLQLSQPITTKTSLFYNWKGVSRSEYAGVFHVNNIHVCSLKQSTVILSYRHAGTRLVLVSVEVGSYTQIWFHHSQSSYFTVL